MKNLFIGIKKYFIVFIVVSAIIAVVFLIVQIKKYENECGYYYDMEINRPLRGEVKEKYLDTTNHNIKMFVYHNGSEEIKEAWHSDFSKFYSDLRIGDSVIKRRYSKLISIKRDDKIRDYVIDYGCY